jgi:hypothetical protein
MQAQEEAEARELGIRLLRTEADLEKDGDIAEESIEETQEPNVLMSSFTKEKSVKGPGSGNKRKSSKSGKNTVS